MALKCSRNKHGFFGVGIIKYNKFTTKLDNIYALWNQSVYQKSTSLEDYTVKVNIHQLSQWPHIVRPDKNKHVSSTDHIFCINLKFLIAKSKAQNYKGTNCAFKVHKIWIDKTKLTGLPILIIIIFTLCTPEIQMHELFHSTKPAKSK